MKRLIPIALLVLLCTTPAFAQTVCRVEPPHDDCPPGAVRNLPVSPLDQAYMEAAFRASFRGIFNREPSMIDGAGKDDGCYYVRASNHYGAAGDGQCHAGWSGYWESWLQVGHGDLALVQTPARFQPSTTPPVPIPIPTPSPTPTPIDPFLQSIMNARFDRVDAEIAGVKQDVADFREAARSRIAAFLKNPYVQVVATAVVAWATTYKVVHP